MRTCLPPLSPPRELGAGAGLEVLALQEELARLEAGERDLALTELLVRAEQPPLPDAEAHPSGAVVGASAFAALAVILLA